MTKKSFCMPAFLRFHPSQIQSEDDITVKLNELYAKPLINAEETYLAAQTKYALTHHKDMREGRCDVNLNASIRESFLKSTRTDIQYNNEILNQNLEKKDYSVPFIIDSKKVMSEFKLELASAKDASNNEDILLYMNMQSETETDMPSHKFLTPVKNELNFLNGPYKDNISNKEVFSQLQSAFLSISPHLTAWRDNMLSLAESETMKLSKRPKVGSKPSTPDIEFGESSILPSDKKNSSAKIMSPSTSSAHSDDTQHNTANDSEPLEPNSSPKQINLRIVNKSISEGRRADTLSTYPPSRSLRKANPGPRLLSLATQRPMENTINSVNKFPAQTGATILTDGQIRQGMTESTMPITPFQRPIIPLKTFAPSKRKLTATAPSTSSQIAFNPPEKKVPRIVSVSGGNTPKQPEPNTTSPGSALETKSSFNSSASNKNVSFMPAPKSPTFTTIEAAKAYIATLSSPIKSATNPDTTIQSSPTTGAASPIPSRTTPPSPNHKLSIKTELSLTPRGIMILPAVPKNFRSKIIKTEVEPDCPRIDQVFCNSGTDIVDQLNHNYNQYPPSVNPIPFDPVIRQTAKMPTPIQRLMSQQPIRIAPWPRLPQQTPLSNGHFGSYGFNKGLPSLVRPPVTNSLSSSVRGTPVIIQQLRTPGSNESRIIVRPSSISTMTTPGIRPRSSPPLPPTPSPTTSYATTNNITIEMQSQQNEHNINNISKQIEEAESDNRLKKLKEEALRAEKAKYPDIRFIQGEQFMICRICSRTFRKGAGKSYREHIMTSHFIKLGDKYPEDYNSDSDDDEDGEKNDNLTSWFKCNKCQVVMEDDVETHLRVCKVDAPLLKPFLRVKVLKKLPNAKKSSQRHRHKSNNRLACGVCNDKHFDTPMSLRQHLAASHPLVSKQILLSPTFRCAVCLKSFGGTKNLIVHGASCKAKPNDETITELAVAFIYCEVCDNSHETLEDTVFCYKNTGIDRCAICLFGKSTRSSFADHMSNYHSQFAPGCTCPFCNRDNKDATIRHFTIKTLFDHIITEHYTPAIQTLRLNVRKRQAELPATIHVPDPSKILKEFGAEAVPATTEELRYQAVLQSKRPLRPKPTSPEPLETQIQIVSTVSTAPITPSPSPLIIESSAFKIPQQSTLISGGNGGATISLPLTTTFTSVSDAPLPHQSPPASALRDEIFPVDLSSILGM